MMPSLAMGVAGGNPGLSKVIAQVFPGVRYQRCLVHKRRNILAKLPRLVARELKPLVMQVFEAPDHRIALRRGRPLLARYYARYPATVECLAKDPEGCITHLLFPKEPWKRIRSANMLERTFAESRRRTKVIPASTARRPVSGLCSPRGSPRPGSGEGPK